MSRKRTLKGQLSVARIALLLVTGLIGGISAPAAALTLETGKCYPAANVRAQLAAEGQQPIIVGNRAGYGYPTAIYFTSNADGTKGYAVRGDKLLGTPATETCVDSVYGDVRLNDISLANIPAWAKWGNDEATALAICRRDKLGYQEKCNSHDTVARNIFGSGSRFMLSARGTAINPRDKSIRKDQMIWVNYTPRTGNGLIHATTPEGADYVLSAYGAVAYTKAGEALIGSR